MPALKPDPASLSALGPVSGSAATGVDEKQPGYRAFMAEVGAALPVDRILVDRFSLLTHGGDASCYRLVPRSVLLVEDEQEVRKIVRAARAHDVAITFRAAGTSLSGQAVTDSVLVKLGRDGWRGFEALEDGHLVRLGPGLIGAHANARLARYGRRIGPDPASINAAMIGGITANNSSGMCCGTDQNTYRTLHTMRIVLTDGTVLDTGSPQSIAAFRASHGPMLDALDAIAQEARGDPELAALIRRKYAIKNTTGYSLNALIDHFDPVDILQHLIVGSEGTLAFVSEVVLETVSEPPCKSAALVLFNDMPTACAAARRLSDTSVSAIELMDSASLRSVVGKPGIPDGYADLPDAVTALLIDLRAMNEDALREQIETITSALGSFPTSGEIIFSTDNTTYANYWNVRKGLLPSVGATRPAGSTVIVEDVAVPLEALAQAAVELRRLCDEHGYHDAIIFGHALDGNLHFVFPQSFNSVEDISGYARFMAAVAYLIGVRFGGSLKAEHGTGRNMAPFVELEWGARAYALMRRIKAAIDPDGILSPGVLLSDDPDIHLKGLKSLPIVDPVADACIECGFCEPVCPSRAFTLTPRQRIIAKRALIGGAEADTDQAFQAAFDYRAVDSCAGDGLCARECPVGIDTGSLMRAERAARHGRTARAAASAMADRFGTVTTLARGALRLADEGRAVFGEHAVRSASRVMHSLSGGRLPEWTPALPPPSPRLPEYAQAEDAGVQRVVLFSSCASGVLGPAHDAPDQRGLRACIQNLCERAGLQMVAANPMQSFCCGMPFESKGFPEQADDMMNALEAHLRELSRDGRDIIIGDTSPCTLRAMDRLSGSLKLMDVAEALATLVLPRLTIQRKAPAVALHVTCSMRRMGKEEHLLAIAQACAEKIIVPEGISCCGFGGDKGLTMPGLNQSALRGLRDQVEGICDRGYSTSRTCEMGLSTHSGIAYQSIAYLLLQSVE